MKNFFSECFTISGRWNRAKFWLYPLYFLLMWIFLLIPSVVNWISYLYSNEAVFIGILSPLVGVWSIIWVIFILLSVYVNIISYIKRLRDLDQSPWLTLIMFIPFISIFLAIYCAFFKGTKWPNQYGPDRLSQNSNTESIKNSDYEL